MEKKQKRSTYTARDLANMLGKNIDTIRRWTKQGRFPFEAMQLDTGLWVYPAAPVEKFVKDGGHLLEGNGMPSRKRCEIVRDKKSHTLYVYTPDSHKHAAKFTFEEEALAQQWIEMYYKQKGTEEDSGEQEQLEMSDSDLQEEIAQLREQLVKEHNLYLEEKKKNAFREAQFDSIMGYLEKIVDIIGREP